MSVRIGQVPVIGTQEGAAYVLASRGGVELSVSSDGESSEDVSLEPVQARNYAAQIVRAADEVERMRGPAEDTLTAALAVLAGRCDGNEMAEHALTHVRNELVRMSR
jgi:hypothetical protein